MTLGHQESLEVAKRYFPEFLAQRRQVREWNRWVRGKHDRPTQPQSASTKTREYDELAYSSRSPYIPLVISAVAQALAIEGHRLSGESRENTKAWEDNWQPNGLDGRQGAVYRAAIGAGLSFVRVLPGVDPLSGGDRAFIKGRSAERCAAFYSEDEDEWPTWVIEADLSNVEGEEFWIGKLYDDQDSYTFSCAKNGDDDWTYITTDHHGSGVPPFVRFAGRLDLDGNAAGEIEPLIPIAKRIDQDVFDRLVVQRFGSWLIRYATGLEKPATDEDARAQAIRVRLTDMLISEDPNSKFGTLAATPLDGYIAAHDADLHDLAAVSQTPPDNLLGQMANLSAEALVAARSSLNAKVAEYKKSFGESWERVFRLAAHITRDEETANNFAAQVKWADTEARSLAQIADALMKLMNINVPNEMLWEKIPGWSQTDTEDAKRLIKAQQAQDRANLLLAASLVPKPVSNPSTDPSQMRKASAGNG